MLMRNEIKTYLSERFQPGHFFFSVYKRGFVISSINDISI